MKQIKFAEKATEILRTNKSTLGLAVAGSWLNNELDEYSDLDLVLVTKEKITDNPENMFAYAKQLGNLLSGFTGEHVGEPRLLVCLYDDPLLHVDIKFVTLDEFRFRIEQPIILLDTEGKLGIILQETTPQFPYPAYQWLEDRFWIWIHYILSKIGRGEYFEALDALSYIRITVLGPLLLIKNENLPRGVRKIETQILPEDLDLLKNTVGTLEKHSLIKILKNTIFLYQYLRDKLFDNTIQLQEKTENRVLNYLNEFD